MRPLHGNYMQIARTNDSVYVMIIGQGNMVNSTTFKEFIDEMLKLGYRKFILDMKNCEGLDSTFMGLILGIMQYDMGDDSSKVLVVNCPGHCCKLLTDLGLTNFLTISKEPFHNPGLEMEILEPVELDPSQRIRLIKAAHERLVAIDERNKEKFGAFLAMISREIDAEDNQAN